jgi:RHS repeat-associated protein
VSGATTSYLYDGANVVQELQGGSPAVNLLSGSIDEVFSRTDAAGPRSLLADALGSTLALVDSAGAIQTQYTYEPFGNTTPSGTPSTNSYQYTGRENDGTGLYYYRARYYDPQIGRFVSEDPLGFDGDGPNFYAYAGNDPIDNADPSGCGFIDCAKAIAELEDALADLALREAETMAAKCDKGRHDKAIEQAKNRVRKALAKARTCLPEETLQKIRDQLNKMIDWAGSHPAIAIGGVIILGGTVIVLTGGAGAGATAAGALAF